MNKCIGLAGYIFGHKYRPRYSTGAPSLDFEAKSISCSALNELLYASTPREYECDVCERCGLFVVGENK